MYQIFIKFIIGFITSVAGFLYVRELINSKEKFLDFRNLLWIVVLSLMTPIIYKINYQAINPVVSYFASVLVYKRIFKYDYFQSSIISGFLLLSLVISDLIQSVVFLSFIPIERVRTDSVIMISTNVLSGLIIYFISTIKKIKNIANKLVFKKEYGKKIKIIVFIILGIIAISCLFFIIFYNYGFNMELIIASIAILLFVILIYVYSKEQLEYNELKNQMKVLIKPVRQFEDWLEAESINRHEYKNNLAVLRSMITDEKAKKFIDDKLNNTLNIDFEYASLLKNVPIGGLKGLLFYKIIEAKQHNLDILFDSSNEVSDFVVNMSDDDFQSLCYLLGIFIDNAIEAASDTKEKKLSIEIYVLNSNILKVVISNSFSGEIELNRIFSKGYTTKGKGRGNGLYFAKKLCDRASNIELKNKLLNNYYIQEIKFYKK